MANGSFKVRTYIAEEAIPVEESVVRIKGGMSENSSVKYSIITDADGVTPSIPLPAPSAENSLVYDGATEPYYTYDVVISKEGYYTKIIYGVSIFEDIETVVPVNMIPYVEYSNGGGYPRGNINTYITDNKYL